ncbi:hypothetical protein LCGC14_1037660 [marine sediment metagenome]|uniref:Uncharacterized protein n=1 Tax=marine sediment metagenome TaxID=412755 RepID=A0A0F9QYW9_9ZZZZ
MSKAKPTMEEQLISFETARLAKEKGFNWATLYAYDGSFSPMVCSHSKTVFKLLDYNSPSGGNYHSAPTQSLLQKWLREKRKIYISIKLEIAYIPRGWYCYIDADSYRLWGSQVYKTYEKALGVGLIKALKLI